MPIYEYECNKCGRYEVMQKITEEPLKKCEKCGSAKVRKLVSQTSFTLKGGGWYKDLYSSTKGGSGSSGSSGSDGSSSGGKKAAAAPAKKDAGDNKSAAA